MKNLFIAVVCVLAMALAGSSSAQEHRGGHNGGGHGPGWAIHQLDLTDEQKNELACETPGQGRELRDNLAAERRKLNDMIRDKATPDDAIYSQFERVKGAQAEFDFHRLQKMLKARSVLTEEQMEKLLSFQKGEGR